MDYRRFGTKIFVRMDPGEEIVAGVKTVAEQESVRLATVTALGAIDRFTVGVFETKEKQYRANSFSGYYEIVSLTGTITTQEGAVYCHLHLSAGDSQGRVMGGHLNEAVVSATCELVLDVVDGCVERRFDEAIGLNLFHF